MCPYFPIFCLRRVDDMILSISRIFETDDELHGLRNLSQSFHILKKRILMRSLGGIRNDDACSNLFSKGHPPLKGIDRVFPSQIHMSRKSQSGEVRIRNHTSYSSGIPFGEIFLFQVWGIRLDESQLNIPETQSRDFFHCCWKVITLVNQCIDRDDLIHPSILATILSNLFCFLQLFVNRLKVDIKKIVIDKKIYL